MSFALAAIAALALVVGMPFLKSLLAKSDTKKDVSLIGAKRIIAGAKIIEARDLINKILPAVNMIAPMIALVLLFAHVASGGAASGLMAVVTAAALPGSENPMLTLALISAAIGIASYALTVLVNYSNIKKVSAEQSTAPKEWLAGVVHGAAMAITYTAACMLLGLTPAGLLTMGALTAINAAYFFNYRVVGKREISRSLVFGYLSAFGVFAYLALFGLSTPAIITLGIAAGVFMALPGNH